MLFHRFLQSRRKQFDKFHRFDSCCQAVSLLSSQERADFFVLEDLTKAALNGTYGHIELASAHQPHPSDQPQVEQVKQDPARCNVLLPQREQVTPST